MLLIYKAYCQKIIMLSHKHTVNPWARTIIFGFVGSETTDDDTDVWSAGSGTTIDDPDLWGADPRVLDFFPFFFGDAIIL